MTITLPLDPIAAFATEHPCATVTLIFLMGIVLPAIWSTHCWRRRAAMAVIRALVDICVAVAAIALAAQGLRSRSNCALRDGKRHRGVAGYGREPLRTMSCSPPDLSRPAPSSKDVSGTERAS